MAATPATTASDARLATSDDVLEVPSTVREIATALAEVASRSVPGRHLPFTHHQENARAPISRCSGSADIRAAHPRRHLGDRVAAHPDTLALDNGCETLIIVAPRSPTPR